MSVSPASDRAEVATLALRVYTVALSRARRLTDNLADAEDLVQEAFTAALARWDKIRLQSQDHQLAWLTRVMINKKIDQWRTPHAIPVPEVRDPQGATASAERTALDREALARCDQVIRTMPPEQRKTAFLRWYCGWTTSEIAEWNGVAEATVRVHLWRARQQLNEEARPHMPFIDDVDDDKDTGGREEAQ